MKVIKKKQASGLSHNEITNLFSLLSKLNALPKETYNKPIILATEQGYTYFAIMRKQ